MSKDYSRYDVEAQPVDECKKRSQATAFLLLDFAFGAVGGIEPVRMDYPSGLARFSMARSRALLRERKRKRGCDTARLRQCSKRPRAFAS